jgi:TonB family protein
MFISIMSRYLQPVVVFLTLGLGLCQALGHSRTHSDSTQETVSEIHNLKDVSRGMTVVSPLRSHFLDIQSDETQGTQSDEEHIYKGKEVDKKPVVKSKPDPEYTAAAQLNRVQGTVVLRCVFTMSGEVKHFFVVSGLPYGLTEASIAAAKKIKFKPAIKDGKPVSIWMELQYNFRP